MRQPRPLLVAGAGGHGTDVLCVIERSGRRQELAGYVDERTSEHFDRAGVVWLGSPNSIVCGSISGGTVVLAVGYGTSRRSLHAQLPGDLPGCDPIVDPTSVVASAVALGAGAVLFPNSSISPGVSVGQHAHVCWNAFIGHGTRVDSFASVLPGSNVSGDCVLGVASTIGSGATVRQGVRVGDGAFVGAGAVVLDDVPDGATVVGNPARPLL